MNINYVYLKNSHLYMKLNSTKVGEIWINQQVKFLWFAQTATHFQKKYKFSGNNS